MCSKVTSRMLLAIMLAIILTSRAHPEDRSKHLQGVQDSIRSSFPNLNSAIELWLQSSSLGTAGTLKFDANSISPNELKELRELYGRLVAAAGTVALLPTEAQYIHGNLDMSNPWSDADFRNTFDKIDGWLTPVGLLASALTLTVGNGSDKDKTAGAFLGISAVSKLLGTLSGKQTGGQFEKKVKYVEMTRRLYDDFSTHYVSVAQLKERAIAHRKFIESIGQSIEPNSPSASSLQDAICSLPDLIEQTLEFLDQGSDAVLGYGQIARVHESDTAYFSDITIQKFKSSSELEPLLKEIVEKDVPKAIKELTRLDKIVRDLVTSHCGESATL